MKFIESAEVDRKRWDALVAKFAEASFFSYSWYLDAVAENWCLLIDNDYSKGIALPYTKRLGVSILYVPIFSRAMHVFGDIETSEIEQIQKRFKVREIATTTAVFDPTLDRVHQVISDYENRSLSTQAKRSLKRATKSGIHLTESESFENVFTYIEAELQGKFAGVDAERLSRLKSLFEAAKKKGMLQVFEVSDRNETGGIVCLSSEDQVLYLKGACPENLKRNGGMYFALNAAIEFAQNKNVPFDFGGSNVEGVRRFNTNLGGEDKSYVFHKSNDAPFWFHWARKLKKRGKG